MKRRAYGEVPNMMERDGEAILLAGFSAPQWIYWSEGVQYRVSGVEPIIPGSTLCASGAYHGSDCGIASDPFVAFPDEGEPMWVVQTSAITTEGDSGGPIWDLQTGNAVGLVEGGYESTGPTWFTPLEAVPLPNGTTTPGLLAEMDIAGGGSFNLVH